MDGQKAIRLGMRLGSRLEPHSIFINQLDSLKLFKYQTEKLPLQRVVQILKRHRDIMFNGDDDKPISIIITTLAALAYLSQTDIVEALVNIVSTMENFIEERYDVKSGRMIKWITNPVDPRCKRADV